jgi:hypothetical protein
VEDFEKWLGQQQEKIAGTTWTTAMEGSVAAYEFLIVMKDGKRQLKRVLIEGRPVENVIGGLLARLGSSPGGAVA